MRLPEPGHGSRNCDRRGAGVEDLLRVAEVDDELDELERRGRLLRQVDEEVEQVRAPLARQMDEEEASAARAR
jgi:hypothetical protein